MDDELHVYMFMFFFFPFLLFFRHTHSSTLDHITHARPTSSANIITSGILFKGRSGVLRTAHYMIDWGLYNRCTRWKLFWRVGIAVFWRR